MKNATPQLYEAILERVRTRIQSNQLTQAEIGKALGIKQSAVSYLLKGKTKLSLEQFLALAELVGERPQQLLADAEAGLTESRPMPKEMEDVLYRTPLHLLAYCAAIRPVTPAQLTIGGRYSIDAARAALDDLARLHVVEKRGDIFVQKQANVNYVASREGADVRFLRHMDVQRLCHELWVKNRDNKAYRAKRFNYFVADYFTPVQMREVEGILWRAYERIKVLQRENMASHYAGDTHSLWHMNFMIATPLEEK